MDKNSTIVPSPDSDEFMTRKETADKLRITLPTLHSWTCQGLLTCYKLGGRVLYSTVEVYNSLTLTESKGKWYK
jgi:predicted site-specific integrase-resolvase